MKRKRKGVATSLSWVGEPSPALPVLLGDRSLESLRRGALGSCLHVLAGPCLVVQSLASPTAQLLSNSRSNSTPTASRNNRNSATLATQLLFTRATTSAKPPCLPFCSAGPRPFAPPPFELHPEPSRRGRALSLSLHPTPFGGRESQFWLGAREIIPPKRDPHLFSPLTSGSDRPSPSRARGS